MNAHVIILSSKIHGIGIFATRKFCAGETICFLKGKEFPIEMLKRDHLDLLQVDEYI